MQPPWPAVLPMFAQKVGLAPMFGSAKQHPSPETNGVGFGVGAGVGGGVGSQKGSHMQALLLFSIVHFCQLL